MKPHLVINYIILEEQEITVGTTDSERWAWDIKEGYSGADARTMVWVTLLAKSGACIQEKVEFFGPLADPLRLLAMQQVSNLLDIAWAIKNTDLTKAKAYKRYFGMQLR